MQAIKIQKSENLNGDIYISGAKNSALPLLTTTLLTDDVHTIKNVPNLTDVETLKKLLLNHGTKIEINDDENSSLSFKMQSDDISDTTAPYELVKTMRASVLVLGPLLAKQKKAKVSLPGGCAIGSRPVELHINALEKLGAKISVENGYINASAENGLVGNDIFFPFVSVGATENIVMAATLAKGETTIHNAAREPEIIDLVRCLKKMGAKIEGEGTSTIKIIGVEKLHGCEYKTITDRIEAVSFICAVAVCGGEIRLHNIDDISIIEYPIDILRASNIQIEYKGNILICKSDGNITPNNITTAPFPEFPTDLQAQFMAMYAIGNGTTTISENIFENRFMHVPELIRMGANITVKNNIAIVQGVEKLTGAQVMATDLRASMSLIIAGLKADGDTIITRVYHIDRGYSNLEDKLLKIGAKIERITIENYN